MQRVKVIPVLVVIALAALALLSPQQPAMSAVTTTLSASCGGNLRVSTSIFPEGVYEFRLNGSGPGLPSAVYISSDSSMNDFVWVLPGPGSWDLLLEWRQPPGIPGWTFSFFTGDLVLTCLETGNDQTAGPPYANLYDGRINDSQTHDGAAPVAAYCAADIIDIYKVDPATGSGRLVIRHPIVSGQPSGGTQLLAQSEGVSLFWLSSGQYQLNTTYADGKPYVITWEGCSGENLTHLAS